MACPHATTTTVAFLYGEAPDAHALHVAACASCAAVVDEHAQVVVALGPALPALRTHAVETPRPGRSWVRWTASLALAAAAVALFLGRGAPPAEPTAPPDPDAGFDVALDALELELTSLEQELR